MKKISTTLLVVLTLFCTITAFSQYGTPRGLENLIDMRGSSADAQLRLKGYRYIKTSKSGSDSYQNWYNANKQKCITCRISNGRVASIVDSKGDCGSAENNSSYDNRYNSNHHNNHYNNNGYNNRYNNRGNNEKEVVTDLVYNDALSAYEKLRSRGFDEVKSHEQGGNTYKVWHNNRTSQCIKTTSRNRKITSVQNSHNCNL